MTKSDRILLAAVHATMTTPMIHEALLQAARGDEAMIDRRLARAILNAQVLLNNLQELRAQLSQRRERVA